MSAHPIAAIQSAADAAYPVQKKLECPYGDTYTVARDRKSGNVVLFRIDGGTGKLSPTKTELKIDVPACIVFVPLHR